jgi:phosphohistidine phosphatase
MQSLTLFRHAKTERDSETGRDFDRRLNERGRGDAARMGREIRHLGLAFDLVLSSPASRAAETADLAGLPAQYDERIYDASAGKLLDLVRSIDASVGSLLMVGHNPGFEQLASTLTGLPVDMPTGSLAEIELAIDDWEMVERGSGKLVRFVKPKELA